MIMSIGSLIFILFTLTYVFTFVYCTIDPSRLLVATVVDISSNDVVRDSIALFRSIRKFGGTLNESTLLACFSVSRFGPFFDDSLLQTFSDMGVVVDFIRQAKHPFAGTMNKFSTLFKFDTTKYDYFLWLDGDILVFDDPLPLYPDIDPTKIYCVPELFNYMIRFPHLNKSDIVWNHKLPPFVLAGDEAVTSHGVCNTGMLFFGHASLQKFTSNLYHESVTEPLSIYCWDRFLDSLFFVAIVNMFEIEVVPVSYSLNYMAFLEIDIMELFPDTHPVFAHFIANTTMNCYYLDTTNECTCMYANDNFIPDNSKIVRVLNTYFLPAPNCDWFASPHRTVLAPTSTTAVARPKKPSEQDTLMCESKYHSSLSCAVSVQDTLDMEILSPARGSEVFFSGTTGTIFVSAVCCTYSTTADVDCSCGNLSFLVVDEMTQAVIWQQNGAAESPSERHCDSQGSTELTRCHKSVVIDVTLNRLQILSMPKNITLGITSKSPGSDISYRAAVSLQAVSRSMKPRVMKRIVAESVPGQGMTALDAQDNLGKYLNANHLVGMGVAVCCDSYRGLRAVEELIRHWGERVDAEGSAGDDRSGGGHQGALLMVQVKSVPVAVEDTIASYGLPTQFHTREELAEYLSHRCDTTHPLSIRGRHLSGCVITARDEVRLFSGSNTNEKFYRDSFLSFVYLDMSFTSHEDYTNSLKIWHDALLRGGVLAGSVYAPSAAHTRRLFPMLPLNELLKVTGVTSAIDIFAYQTYQMVMVTYLEFLSDLNANGASVYNTLPAWYIVKLQ
jgi:hypothetical protein